MKKREKLWVSAFSIFRYLLISFCVFTTLFLAILTYMETYLVNSHDNQAIANDVKALNTQEKFIAEEFDRIISDLIFLKHQFCNGLYIDNEYQAIKQQWIMFSDSKKIYDQIRFINSDGYETIRVDLGNEGAYLVEEDKLADKSDSYYFSRTCAVGNDTIYISEMDLNKEGERVEIPYKPMIRLSAPIYDRDEKFVGMIIVNYLADNLLNSLKHYDYHGALSLLNKDGFYLLTEDKTKQWGFMFDDKQDMTMGKLYPDVWANIANGKIVFEDEKDVYVTKQVDLVKTFSEKDANLVFDDNNFVLLSKISNESSFINIKHRILVIIGDRREMFIIIFIASIMVALALYYRQRHYHTLKYFSEYDGLTNILNRRSGITYLERMIDRNRSGKKNLTICFMDIDELKQVNDRYGHDKGDEYIYTVVECVKNNIDKQDLFIRLGGDEFLIAFNNKSLEQGHAIVDKINSTINLINKLEDRQYTLKVSSGLISINEIENLDVEYLIKLADERMYTNKDKRNKNVIKEVAISKDK